MRHPPTAQLLHELCFASDRHLPHPLHYPQPESPVGSERQIDQIDIQQLASLEVVNGHAIVRFGGIPHFYRSKANNASQKSKTIVH
jgi:hypothetical protein